MNDPAAVSVGIVLSCFDAELSEAFLQEVLSALEKVESETVVLGARDVFRVPGAFEIPYVLMMKALSKRYEVLMGLGVVVAGKTHHHEVIAHATAKSFQEIMLRTGCPVLNGIVVAKDRQTAPRALRGGRLPSQSPCSSDPGNGQAFRGLSRRPAITPRRILLRRRELLLLDAAPTPKIRYAPSKSRPGCSMALCLRS